MVLAPTEYRTTVSNSKDNFLLFCVFSPDVHGAPGPEISSPGSTTIDWHAPINVTFPFVLDSEEGQRSLLQDIAIALWRLVFKQHTPSILEGWLDFLGETPSGVRSISQDTWNIFLNFTQAIGPDLSNYSEDEAWPGLFDTFVEWEMECRKKEEEESLALRAKQGS